MAKSIRGNYLSLRIQMLTMKNGLFSVTMCQLQLRTELWKKDGGEG